MTWNLAETFGTPPLPRHGHTANILMNYLVIFGGANEKDIFHDVTMLNLRNMEWYNLVNIGSFQIFVGRFLEELFIMRLYLPPIMNLL